jgi:hypothetical protein
MPQLKVVACTNIWESKGESRDFPMWQSIGCREYIIGRTNKVPTLEDIGAMITSLQHILEGRITPSVIEVITGHEVYEQNNLTHNENFQLKYGDAIDFPAEDITNIQVEE